MKKKFTKLLLSRSVAFLLLFVLSGNLFAQEKTLTGKVTSADDKTAVPGASIKLKGKNTGTVTDANGAFKLSVPANSTLILSSVGYKTQEIQVGSQSDLTIMLQSDQGELEEVVVIGYGSVLKKDLVGSVGVAKRKDFGEVNATTAEQLLQGKIAGVQVVNATGLPGSGAKIFIRGTGSFTNSDPLYLIDGFIGDINLVAPNEIEEITVLKDASSVAIYGAKAANGVVLVTTKKGKTGAMKVTYTTTFGVANAWKRLDLMKARDYVDLVTEMVGGKFPTDAVVNKPYALVDRTDWQDQVFQRGNLMTHGLNISGGSDKVTYNVALNYVSENAILQRFEYQRYNFRVALEEKLGSRVKIGQTLNLRYQTDAGVPASFVDAIRMPPYAPVLDPNNEGGYSNITPNVDLQDAQNPQTRINLIDKRWRNVSGVLQLYGEVQITDWLKFRSQASLDGGFYSLYEYSKQNRNGNLFFPRSLSETVGNGIYNPLIEDFLTFNKEFGGVHNLTAMVGHLYASGNNTSEIKINGAEFPNDELPNLNGAGKTTVSGGGRFSNYNTRWSYYGRLQYGYKSKYLLTASYRTDYSPSFGVNNRAGSFPAVGLAWKMSDEPFMKDLIFISDLKVRASWGRTGNDNIGLFKNTPNGPVFRGYLPGAPTYSLGGNKDFYYGATVASLGNPNLQWEETTQTNFGFDLALLKNKLVFTFDAYNRLNDKLLVNVPVSPSTGLGEIYNPPSIPTNAASAFNRGYEVSFTFQERSRPFKYAVSANLSYNKNEVTSLGTQGSVPIPAGGFADVSATQKTDVGLPIGAYWGWRVDKVASTAAEIKRLDEIAISRGFKSYQDGLLPGDIIFKDINGDGTVDDKDQTQLGGSIPIWQYGANLSASYKNFDFMAAITGIGGVELANSLIYDTEGTNKVFNHSVTVINRWRKEGDIATIPKANQNATGTKNLRPSDRYIESGAYMRVRNVTFGYNFNQNTLKSVFGNTISSIRLYTTAQNLITVTNYRGYDPEVLGGNGIFERGVDRGNYPQPRTFIFGLQVGF